MAEHYTTIILDKKPPVATITMNRPERLNACNTTMYKELDHALCDIEVDKSIKAVIITGAGEKAFSAGADLEELDFADLEASTDYIKIDARTFRHLENIPQPVIAAVGGAAIGYGCKVAIISDIVVASSKATFALPGTTFGAVHVITLGRGREVINRNRLAYMLLTGESIDAHKAEKWGIVTQVVEPDQVMAEAQRIALKIAACPPLAVQVTRRMLHRGCDDDYRWEDLLSPGLLLMQDLKEGQQAFMERRKPKFTGR